MSSFLRRLKYYGIGFGIGLVFVIFFFQNRGCSWLPANRVKNSFLDRILVVPEHEYEVMEKYSLSEKDVINVLNDGSVHFDQSVKQGSPQVYAMSKEIKGTSRTFYFTLPKESFISEIHFTEKSAKQVKNTKTGFGKIIYFPNDEDLVFVDSTDLVTCQQSQLGLINPRDIFKLIKKSGKIDFSKTHYSYRPKPEQYIEFIDSKGRVIGARMIWYKNKMNITSFEIPFKTECN